MKKILLLVIIFTITISSVAFAKNEIEIKVYVDGELVVFPDQKPFVDKNGRTLVPVRFPAEKFGAEVEWENSERRVDIKHYEKEREIKLWIGSSEYTVNKEVKNMDTEAVLINERTMIPIRFVAEALDVRVDWRQISDIGLVFNFTKGQNEEEINKIINKIVDEVSEKNNTVSSKTEKINKSAKLFENKGFTVLRNKENNKEVIRVFDKNEKKNLVISFADDEKSINILAFNRGENLGLAIEIMKEIGINNKIENIIDEFFITNKANDFEIDEKTEIYIEGGKRETDTIMFTIFYK